MSRSTLKAFARRGSVWVLWMGLLAACAGEPPSAEPPNVLLLLVDTLRADRLSVYGYERDTSPFLESFAQDAVRFDNVHAQAGCTFPSVNSILTSRYTAPFLRAARTGWGIPETTPSLPRILRAEGYATAAISASPVVRASPSNINHTGGFDGGFEHFDEECLNREASCVNQRALALLSTLEEPYFLYLHYMDPHGPYQPPPEHARKFALAPPPRSPKFLRLGNPLAIARRIYGEEASHRLNAEQVAYLRSLYDEEIAYVDQKLGELLQAVQAMGLARNTVVVVMSDHGEELLEHGEISHCRNLIFENVMRVPLLIRFPGHGPARVDQPVENIDLVPTLLDYLGLDPSAYAFQGRSLLPTLEGASPRGLAFLRQGVHRAVTDGQRKLIYDVSSGQYRLHDLATDPLERADVATEHPEAFRRLRRELILWLEREEGEDLGKSSAEEAERLQEELRAVGYLG
jgi:arylsulfatase A-like enzyme